MRLEVPGIAKWQAQLHVQRVGVNFPIIRHITVRRIEYLAAHVVLALRVQAVFRPTVGPVFVVIQVRWPFDTGWQRNRYSLPCDRVHCRENFVGVVEVAGGLAVGIVELHE